MSFKCGMPVLKLDRANHFGKNYKHSGNAKAVACEALKERYCSDPDYNDLLTSQNKYYGVESGEKLYEFWAEKADQYRVKDKTGKEKKLRSDAGIGFAGIIKPEKKWINSLTRDEQIEFFEKSQEVIKKLYKDRGMILNGAVIHFDEGAPHMHYFGYDPGYQLGKKLGLPLYHDLNQEYPKQMKALGYDMQELKGYDTERTKGMSEDELNAYKMQFKHKREEHGRTSKSFKKRKTDEHLRNARAKEEHLDALIEAGIQKGIESKAKELEAEKRALNDQIKAYKDKLEREYKEKLERELKAITDAYKDIGKKNDNFKNPSSEIQKYL